MKGSLQCYTNFDLEVFNLVSSWFYFLDLSQFCIIQKQPFVTLSKRDSSTGEQEFVVAKF